jgi:hypothetical protein
MLIILVVLANRVSPLFSSPILGDLVQNINFVISCFYVVLGTLLNLQGNVAVELEILGQPDGREVTPTQFLDNDISIKQDLADMDWMIATDLVVRHALVLAGIFIFVKAFIKEISEWSKVFVFHVRKLVTMVPIAHIRRVIVTGLWSFYLFRLSRGA